MAQKHVKEYKNIETTCTKIKHGGKNNHGFFLVNSVDKMSQEA